MCYEEGQLYLAGLVATTWAAPERSYSGCWYPHGERQRVNVSKVDASTEKEDATPSRLARGDAHRWVCYQDGPRSVQHGAGPRRNWPSLATEKASAFLLTTAAQTSQTMSRNTGVTGVMILSRKAFDKRLWGNPHAVGECCFLHCFIFKERISKLVCSAHSLQRDRDTGEMSGEKRQLTWV